MRLHVRMYFAVFLQSVFASMLSFSFLLFKNILYFFFFSFSQNSFCDLCVRARLFRIAKKSLWFSAKICSDRISEVCNRNQYFISFFCCAFVCYILEVTGYIWNDVWISYRFQFRFAIILLSSFILLSLYVVAFLFTFWSNFNSLKDTKITSAIGIKTQTMKYQMKTWKKTSNFVERQQLKHEKSTRWNEIK